ncbi:hypothetical protein JKP88DRAFT_348235 [Tribonema minus]|uniref:Uncharacterized protein n=1 Tax=Tribonema minus TaxID=303371 RepID=A0A835ZB47_9STRA|nr:hypothetical protein JKP88DRAFT_348235 [Tribonema minus]
MAVHSVLSLLLVATACVSAFVVPSGGLARVSARSQAPSMLLGGVAAAAAASIISTAPASTDYLRTLHNQPVNSWTMLSKTETREGFYGEYSVDVKEQEVDNADSTFKSKEATEKGKNKYNAVLLILLVGSFVIPMVQYWWYIRDEDVDYE